MSSRAPRIAALAFMAITLAVHSAMAWMYPLLRDDWTALLWNNGHAHHGVGGWLYTFVTTHFTLGELGTYVLAVIPMAHAVITPLVFLAMLIGIVTVALRKLPRFDTWTELAMLAGVSAFWWIGQPHAGIAVAERGLVAQHLYGTTAVVWLVAAYVCNWEPRRMGRVAIIIAAFVVGIASRQVAVAATVGAWWYVWRASPERRRPWMTWVAGTLLVATVLGYMDTPRFTIPRSDVDANLGVIFMAVREGGELITLVMVFVFVKLLLDRRAGVSPSEGLPNPLDAWRWVWIATVIDVISLPGPRFTEATLTPATAALCIAAAPFLAWLARTRLVRYLLTALVSGTLVVAWTTGLIALSTVHREGVDRLHRVTSAKPDELLTIPPYSQMVASFWFSGEDWGNSSTREHVAIGLFQLQDIDFTTAFFTYERNPRLALHLETDGLSADALRAVPPPFRWASNVGIARQQFEHYVRLLKAAGYHDFSVRLRVDTKVAGSADRPAFAAWYEKGALVSPRVSRSNPDAGGVLRMRVRGEPSGFSERFAVNGDAVTTLVPHETAFKLVPPTVAREVLLACTQDRCLVLDSFMPRSSAPE